MRSKKTLFKGGLIWDGIGETAVAGHALLVKDGLISQIGPVAEFERTDYDDVMDWSDATIMPGLIDSHTHLSMDPTLDNYLDHMQDSVAELTLRATAMMRKDLSAGVTTCRCCGDREFLDIACRKAVESGLVTGPHLLVATRGIRAPHGHGFVGYSISGIDQIRSTIRENIEAGADFIKIYITGTLKGDGTLPSFMKKEELAAAIDEAHRGGVRVAAHCVGGIGLDWALELGLDSLEHVYHISDEQIDKLVATDTHTVLTPSPILTHDRVLHLPENLIEGHIQEREAIAHRMAAVIDTGIPFAVGTDGMHGALVDEMAHLLSMGASNGQALRAATINGATVCGIEGRTGSLEPGKHADMLAVKGNPFEDISALKNVVAVIKKGGIVYKYPGN